MEKFRLVDFIMNQDMNPELWWLEQGNILFSKACIFAIKDSARSTIVIFVKSTSEKQYTKNDIRSCLKEGEIPVMIETREIIIMACISDFLQATIGFLIIYQPPLV